MTAKERAAFLLSFEDNDNKTVSIEFGDGYSWDTAPVDDFFYAYTYKEISKTMYLELRRNFKSGIGMFYDYREYLDD